MAATIAELDTTKYQAQMRALLSVMPRALAAELLLIEAKELIRRVVSFLPPHTHTEGRKAVARDIGRTMRALDPTKYSGAIRQLLISGDLGEIQKWVDNQPGLWGLTVALFDPVLHTSKRNNRGRVSGANKPALVPQPDLVKGYTVRVQNRVGLLKAGYAAAAVPLGLTLPKWITRHGSSLGSYEMRITSAAGMQSVTIGHRSGKWPDHRRVVQDALGYRVEAMKTKVARLVAGKWVNLGGTIGRVGG